MTTDDLKANPVLKFAEGAEDIGVIMSWNTEGSENKAWEFDGFWKRRF